MIRELAESPNVHQALAPGRELVHDPDGRFAVYLAPGTGPHSATVQRVRLAAADVEPTLAEIRALLRARGRTGAEWELGESSEPGDLVPRLLALGLRHDPDEPVAIGMVLHGRPADATALRIEARRVGSVDELATARAARRAAFGGTTAPDDPKLAADFAREGVDGSTFVAFLDGRPVAAAYSAYTPWGVILFGGATVPDARGQGAYRSLVAARARDAEERGMTALVTHAGRMSRPILERLGFTAVARIDRLLDVFESTG